MHEPTRESIRRPADDASFVRGMGYVAEGRVYDAVLADNRLTGRAVGSMEVAYEMEMILGPDGVESGRCTCPRTGFCSHLAALGLLCIEKPQEVTRIDSAVLAGRLRERDPDELLELIVQRAVDDPGFGRRVMALVGTEGIGTRAEGVGTPFPSLVAQYRDIAGEVTPAWSSNPYRAGHRYASGIRELLMRGAREAASDPVRLLAFYTGVYQAIEHAMEQVDDSDGAVGGAAWECVVGMGQTVARSEVDGESRRAWLEIVVQRFLQNDYGHGDGLGEAIAQAGSTEDAGVAIDLLRASLTEQTDGAGSGGNDDEDVDGAPGYLPWSSVYQKTITCELLASLLRRTGREQEIDAIYLDAGLHYHHVLHRIAVDDGPGALVHAREYLRDGHDVSCAGRAFLDAGMPAEALAFFDHVVPLLQAPTPHRGDIIAAWADAAERSGAIERALDLRYQGFCEGPSVQTYGAVMETAQALDRGAELDRKMIRAVPENAHGLGILADIHIHRKDVDAAIETFERIDGYRSDELALRLAELAAKDRPETSRCLITDFVERQIAGKSRSHYARAAAVAARLRDAMPDSELGQYLDDLRFRYKRLPALQDELNRVFGA